MNRKQLLLLLLWYATQSIALDNHYAPSHDGTSAIAQKKIALFMHRYKIPGMAMVLYTNGRPYFFTIGYADKEKKIPVTHNTIFEIGSISKIFTCLLLAQEVLMGNMQLSDPIKTYIPSLGRNRYTRTMSLEKLATHTSQLPFNAPERIKSKEGLIRHLAVWRPNTPPLTWCYSNHGIELLRMALEESTHTPIQNLLIDRILSPLNMSEIGVQVPTHYQEFNATGYDKQGNRAPHWNHPFLIGSAAVRASSLDMLQFLKLAMGLPETPHELRQAMQLTQTACVKLPNMYQGLGWHITPAATVTIKKTAHGTRAQRLWQHNRIFNGNALIEKTGHTHGFHAYIATIPNKQSGIVIMINRALPHGSTMVKKFGREVMYATM